MGHLSAKSLIIYIEATHKDISSLTFAAFFMCGLGTLQKPRMPSGKEQQEIAIKKKKIHPDN